MRIAITQRYVNPSRRLTRRVLARGLLGWAATTIASDCFALSLRRVLKYRVNHSIYGNIGDYSNSIDRGSEETVVRTQIRLLVEVLGIVLHREEAERTERWRGDRLIAFHGVTTVNGEPSVIVGEARADGFVITTPRGVVVAPVDVRPSNPWSAEFLRADTMMLSDSGKLEHVRISQPKDAVILVNNGNILAREYEISADPSYKVWLDTRDIPVMFLVNDDSGTVTFTLVEAS